MPKTKTRTLEDVRAELGEVRAQLKEWEGELASLQNQAEPDYEAVQDPATLEMALEADRRRGQLPMQIRAGKIRSVQLEIEALAFEKSEAEGLVEEYYSELEKANERLREAQELQRRASGAWHDARYGVSDIRREIDRLEKQLHQLKSERVTEASKGPVVRSQWQASTFDAGTEEGAEGDAPGSFAFGSANVSDPPLASGQDARPAHTAVIPEKALREHQKKGG